MRLFHFSDDPAIVRFEPRPVRVLAQRSPGMEWLNGPLVWAIDEAHAPLYLFPRDCPRVLMWPTEATTADDRDQYWNGVTCHMIAHIERAWLDRLNGAHLYRYELPADGFEDLADAGMHVHRGTVEPRAVVRIDNLQQALRSAGVALRVMESLLPLKAVWNTSLQVSGIRLRHAQGW